jgi:hypothetical protein
MITKHLLLLWYGGTENSAYYDQTKTEIIFSFPYQQEIFEKMLFNLHMR